MAAKTIWTFDTPLQARQAVDELRSDGLPMENVHTDEARKRLVVITADATQQGIAEILRRHGLQPLNRDAADARAADEAEAPAAARALAFVIAGRGCLGEAELDSLTQLNAFTALGVDADQLARLVEQAMDTLDGSLREQSWIPSTIEAAYHDVLDAVPDGEPRDLVHHLATAVCQAGGGQAATHHEVQLLLDQMVARWQLAARPGIGTAGR
jgi:hypothetical protein